MKRLCTDDGLCLKCLIYSCLLAVLDPTGDTKGDGSHLLDYKAKGYSTAVLLRNNYVSATPDGC